MSPAQRWVSEGPESGLDRMDSTLFALMILSRIVDRPLARLRASLTRYGRRRFAPSLTRSSTRTTSIQAIKAAISISATISIFDPRRGLDPTGHATLHPAPGPGG